MASIVSALRTKTREGGRGRQQPRSPGAAGPMLLPLAMAQFLASCDTSSMRVAMSRIAHDLRTTATAVQTAISLFALTMAALMIGSKPTDGGASPVSFWASGHLGIWASGHLGIWVYGLGALVTGMATVRRQPRGRTK